MKTLKKFLAAVVYRLTMYKKVCVAVIKHLLGKTYYSREDNYWGYIGETKQLYCQHKNISRLTSTKFYCTECGKTFQYIPEKIVILSDLIGILLLGSIFYCLLKRKK